MMVQTKSTQHPLSDTWFTHVISILQACAIDNGGCEECELHARCMGIFDSLAEKCSDNPLTVRDFLFFVVKFGGLLDGAEKVKGRAEIRKYMDNDYIGIVNILGITVYRCLRCQHAWITRKDTGLPKFCASCNSPYWNKPKKEDVCVKQQ